MVLVEGAGVLGEWRQRDAERAERLAVRRVGVGGGDDLGSGRVDRRVQHERRAIDVVLAVHDVAVVIEQDQIGRSHMSEAHAERVDPKQVGVLRVADGDVAGHTLAEPEPSEDAQRAGELRLAVGALLLDGVEGRRSCDLEIGLRGEWHPVDRAGLVRCCRCVLGHRHGTTVPVVVPPLQAVRPTANGTSSIDVVMA